jgi:hypothetical protein
MPVIMDIRGPAGGGVDWPSVKGHRLEAVRSGAETRLFEPLICKKVVKALEDAMTRAKLPRWRRRTSTWMESRNLGETQGVGQVDWRSRCLGRVVPSSSQSSG